MNERKPPKLLITDLDNTLYDWFGYFVPSVYRMIDRAAEILDVPRPALIDELRVVHQRHHDVEHPFALLETATAERWIRETSLATVASRLDPAFHEFNKGRIELLQLYPTVYETLEELAGQGVTLIAYSESKKHAVVGRLSRLGLLGLFDRIYCRESSPSSHPDPERAKQLSAGYPKDKLVEQPREARKPAPEVLLSICERESVSPREAVYVGDSRVKDVLMANRAGLLAVWARYGDLARREDYERLVAISHWTADDVERERMLRSAGTPKPDLVLKRRFAEVRALFRRSARWRGFPRRDPARRVPARNEVDSPSDLPVPAVGDSS